MGSHPEPLVADREQPAGATGAPRARAPRTVVMVPRTPLRRALPVLVVLIALALIAAALVVVWRPDPVPVLVVPDVRGQDVSAAHDLLVAQGFTTALAPATPDADAPALAVLRTDPGPGAEVDADTPVLLTFSSGPPPVGVPDVAALPLAEAEERLRAAGLGLGPRSEQADPSVPAGAVIRADPAPGVALPRGVPVSLVVSTGPPDIVVPDLLGLPAAEAEQRLLAAGLGAGPRTEQLDPAAPAGTVLRADPAPGVPVQPGAPVALVVSAGPPPLVLPRVIGDTESAAVDLLRRAGLEVEIVRYASSTVPAQLVAGQVPEPGEEVPSGATITLVVSSG
jgi:serine/threonine-protein kinase